MHLLKDGEWRRVVDSWQALSERFVSNPVIYVVLGTLLALFMALKFRKRKKQNSQVVSKNAARWIAVLVDAEKQLSRLGFNRVPGETVSAFAKRVEQTLNTVQIAAQTTKKASPKDSRYENEVSLALEQLREYERNRWRIED